MPGRTARAAPSRSSTTAATSCTSSGSTARSPPARASRSARRAPRRSSRSRPRPSRRSSRAAAPPWSRSRTSRRSRAASRSRSRARWSARSASAAPPASSGTKRSRRRARPGSSEGRRPMRARSTILTLLLASATPAPGADVTYFPADKVATAFAKCAVLFDGAGRNYMVHASRREAAGQAEVHVKDADIIYVLEGSTTFVTGGTVVDGKTTAPNEIRGTAVKDGETRRLGKGDVIIVPNGTPHWFKEVDGPVLYYVVKVR